MSDLFSVSLLPQLAVQGWHVLIKCVLRLEICVQVHAITHQTMEALSDLLLDSPTRQTKFFLKERNEIGHIQAPPGSKVVDKAPVLTWSQGCTHSPNTGRSRTR